MTLDILLVIGLAFGCVLGVALTYAVLSRSSRVKAADPALTQWLGALQQSLQQTNHQMATLLSQQNQTIHHSLHQSSEGINRRLENATQVVGQITKELAQMNELGQTMKELQLLLQAPKHRGNLGEEILKDMLSQAFPKGSFFLQYAFKRGDTVDAAIKTAAGIVPIDAKFPLENFHKKLKAETAADRKLFEKAFINDVKKHIKTIATKYIVTHEGTVDFALMYIPSESVFYEIATINELLEYARSQRVYPVSPNTLYVHLQTILLSFEGQNLENKSKEVMQLLKTLAHEYQAIEGNFKTLGKHITHASQQYHQVSVQFDYLGQKLQPGHLDRLMEET